MNRQFRRRRRHRRKWKGQEGLNIGSTAWTGPAAGSPTGSVRRRRRGCTRRALSRMNGRRGDVGVERKDGWTETGTVNGNVLQTTCPDSRFPTFSVTRMNVANVLESCVYYIQCCSDILDVKSCCCLLSRALVTLGLHLRPICIS